MSTIPRNPFVHPGKTARGLTSLLDAIPQGLPTFDTANTMGIFRSVTGKTCSVAEESEIVRSATVQLELFAEKLLRSLLYAHLKQLPLSTTCLDEGGCWFRVCQWASKAGICDPCG